MVVIGPLYHGTIPDDRVKHGRLQDGRGGGPLQPAAGDDQGGEEERERHTVKEEFEKEADKKEELSHLDLAESWSSWRERHRGVVMRPYSKCKLCESGSEDFKYGSSKCRDLIKSLEDLAEQLYIWKRPGVAYGGRKHEAGYNSMANERRSAMKHHGLDVTCVSTCSELDWGH